MYICMQQIITSYQCKKIHTYYFTGSMVRSQGTDCLSSLLMFVPEQKQGISQHRVLIWRLNFKLPKLNHRNHFILIAGLTVRQRLLLEPATDPRFIYSPVLHGLFQHGCLIEKFGKTSPWQKSTGKTEFFIMYHQDRSDILPNLPYSVSQKI